MAVFFAYILVKRKSKPLQQNIQTLLLLSITEAICSSSGESLKSSFVIHLAFNGLTYQLIRVMYISKQEKGD